MQTESQSGLFGMAVDSAGEKVPGVSGAAVAAIGHRDEVDALTSLMEENERLFEQLATTIRRVRKTREWLAAPGCDPELGISLLRSLRKRRQRLAEALDANRVRARVLLDRSVLGGQAETLLS